MTEASTPPAPPLEPPPGGVFANPQFRRIWMAGGATAMMRWLDFLVLGVFAFELTDSAGDVALAFLVRMLPRLLFGVPVGTLADRVNRKRLWVMTLIALSAVSFVLAVLIASDGIQFWQLLVAVFVAGFFWSVEFPTRRALIADVVRHDQIGRAVGLDWSTDSFAKMVGPGLGGGLIVLMGAEGAYFVAGGAFAVATFVAATVPYRPSPREALGPSPWRLILDGLHYVRRRELLVAALMVTIIFNLVFPAYNALLPVIGKEILGANPLRVGILGSVEGLGSLLGALAIATRASPPNYPRIYYFGTVWFLVCALAFSQSNTYVLSALIVFLLGFGFACFATMQTTLLVANTGPDMRGRVLGVLSLCIGAGPLGALQVGPLTDAVGDSAGLAIVVGEGALLMLATLVVWPLIIRRAAPTAVAAEA